MAELRRNYSEDFNLADTKEHTFGCAGATKVCFFCKGGTGTFQIRGAIANETPVAILGMTGIACVVGELTEIVNAGIFSKIQIVNDTGAAGAVIGNLSAYWS